MVTKGNSSKTSTGGTGAEGAGKTKAAPAKASGGTKAKAPKRTPAKKTKKSQGSDTATKSIIQDAKSAAADIEKQRALAASRKSDPLWFRIEDIFDHQDPSSVADKRGVLPEQNSIVENALAHNGLSRSDVTPQAMACLLEQARKFAQELINDAEDYSNGKVEISKADLQLAVDLRPDRPVALSAQMPALSLIAQDLNRRPLPPIPSQCVSGIVLPSREHRLTARTFDVLTRASITRRMTQKPPEAPRELAAATATESSSTPAYGAERGRQIPINLKERASADVSMEGDAKAQGGTNPQPTPTDGLSNPPPNAESRPTPSSGTGDAVMQDASPMKM